MPYDASIITKKIAVVLTTVSGLGLIGCQTAPTPHQAGVVQTSVNSKPVPLSLEQQVAHTLIVMHQPSVDQLALQRVIQNYQGVITHQYTSIHGFAVRFPVGTPMQAVSTAIGNIAGVTSVESDSIQTIQPIHDVK